MAGQRVQYAISTGLDEGSNPKAVPPGTLKTGHNVRFDKAGRLSKCWGTELIGSSLGGARRLIVRDDTLSAVQTNGQNAAALQSYSEALGAWRNSGPVPDVGLTWQTVRDSTQGARSYDFAISGNYLIVAWVEGDPSESLNDGTAAPGFLWYQVLDVNTGQPILPPRLLDETEDDVNIVRVLAIGGYVYFFWSAPGGVLNTRSLTDFSLGTLTSTTALISTLTTALRFDACQCRYVAGSPTKIFIAWDDSGTNLKGRAYTPSAGTLTASGAAVDISTTPANFYAIAVAPDISDRVWVGYYSASTNIVYGANCTIGSAGTTVNAFDAQIKTAIAANQVGVVDDGNATQGIVVWSGSAVSGDQQYFGHAAVDDTGAVNATSQKTFSSMRLVSSPFRRRYPGVDEEYRHLVFVCDYYNIDNQPTPSIGTYLIELNFSYLDAGSLLPPRMIGKVDHGIGGFTTDGSLPRVPFNGSNETAEEFRCPIAFQATAPQIYQVLRQGIRDVRVLFDNSLPKDMWRSVEISRESYIQAGGVFAWDGRAVFDISARTPAFDALTASANSGNVANGNYLYQITPAYRSFAGILHRGPPSEQRSVTVSALNAKVEVRAFSHAIDNKLAYITLGNAKVSVMNLEVYRSVVNATVPQKLTVEPSASMMLNDLSSTDIAITDNKADANIVLGVSGGQVLALSARPSIYTQGGELEAQQPIAPFGLVQHAGRVFIIGGSKTEVWWSKFIDDNPGIAPEFNSTQRMLFDEPLSALASMDDKLVVFSERSIWVVLGDGPDVNGDDNRFSTPRSIQSDVGCKTPRSVVSMPDGIMFESYRGLYLLTRGLELLWIGQPVRDTLASFPHITSAVLVDSENEVRFTCNDAAGSSATAGRVLVFDYVRKQWLTRSYTISGTANAPIADAQMWRGVWTAVTPTGRAFKEKVGNYLAHDGTFVPSTIRFAPVNGDGPMSWQRMKDIGFAGEAVSNHALTLNVYRDYVASVDQTKAFDAGSAVTTPGPFEQAILDVKVQKGQAYELEITDAAPANTVAYPLGNGAGFRLEGIVFHVQPKSGMPRLEANRRG